MKTPKRKNLEPSTLTHTERDTVIRALARHYLALRRQMDSRRAKGKFDGVAGLAMEASEIFELVKRLKIERGDDDGVTR